MTTTTYTVTGMTCGHCAAAVEKELKTVDGVTDVQVDVDAGTVTVNSNSPLEQSVVSAAIDEAGYTLEHV